MSLVFNSNAFNTIARISQSISLKIVSSGLGEAGSTLDRVMAWCRAVTEPLSTPVVFAFSLVYCGIVHSQWSICKGPHLTSASKTRQGPILLIWYNIWIYIRLLVWYHQYAELFGISTGYSFDLIEACWHLCTTYDTDIAATLGVRVK